MNATPPTLENLLQGVAAGDQHSFRELYRRTASRLLGVAVRLLGDRQRGEDVLQEAFVSIWHHAATFSPAKAQAITWMNAIVRNRALNVLRAAPVNFVPIRQTNAEGEEEDMELPDERSGPLDNLLALAMTGCCMTAWSASRKARARHC